MKTSTTAIIVILISISVVMSALYVGALRDLNRSREVNAQMYDMLSPSQKSELKQNWKEDHKRGGAEAGMYWWDR